MNLDTYLAHYGVKGMKWGVRKKRTPSSKPKQKRVSEMSDEELEGKVKRLRKEAEYKRLDTELKKGNPSTQVKKILITSGTVVATTYTQKFMKAGVEALIKMGYAQLVKRL